MSSVEWSTCGLIDYESAIDAMTLRVDDIIKGIKPEAVWLLEHPPVYTAGTSARSEELLVKDLFPVVYTTRGGKFSYHGPGQRVAYVMIDLKKRNRCDIREYVRGLGDWVVNTLAEFSVRSYFSSDNIGVWVDTGNVAKKIAAFGIRVRRWVTYHGIAVNISTDLSHYSGIVPCGIFGSEATSLKDLGMDVTYESFDEVLKREFHKVFG